MESGNLVVLDADDVDARELEALGRVEGEQVDTIGSEVDALGRRKSDAFEQSIDTAVQCSVGLLRQRSQPRHRRRISLGRISAFTESSHELASAEFLDDFLEVRCG